MDFLKAYEAIYIRLAIDMIAVLYSNKNIYLKY